MQDEKTLKWQYIGIIVCVCIVLTLAVVSSFVFAVSPNVKVAEAYVNQDNNVPYPIEMKSLTIDLVLNFDAVADSTITSYDVSFYSIFDEFIDVYNDLYDTSYTSAISSGRGDINLFTPICFVIPSGYFDYYSNTTNSSFTYTIRQYNKPLDTTTQSILVSNANTDRSLSTNYTCYGAKLSIPISWNNTYPGAGVLGEFEITQIVVYYIENHSAYSYGYYVGDSAGVDRGYQLGLSDGSSLGYQQGYDAGYVAGVDESYDIGYSNGEIVGYDNGYNVGFNAGYNDGYVQAGVDGADYSWQGMVSAIIDVPVRALVGKWEDADGDGQYELVGGLFNFYIPELDLNLAPILLSLITICVIVVILRFVFQFL